MPISGSDDVGAAIEFIDQPAVHLKFHVLVPQLPFGGVGRSGMGTYHGRKPARPDPALVYPPYTKARDRLLRRFF
jgi:aldehyde dehydrogenase (NAD+)